MSTYQIERPWTLAPACAPAPRAAAAHAPVVGLPAVWRSRESLIQQQSVQSIGAPVAGPRVPQLVAGSTTDHGTNGFVAQTTGMTKATRKGGKVSGIPPRERQV
jgi:hypothetical protein